MSNSIYMGGMSSYYNSFIQSTQSQRSSGTRATENQSGTTETKNNFISTILMIVLCYISTYWFLPELLTWVCKKISLTTFAVTRFEIFATLLPLDTINGYLTFINTNTNATELGMMMFSAMIISHIAFLI